MEKIRVGVIGAGAISPSHCRGVKAHPKGDLVAIADSSEPRARDMSGRFDIPRVFSDYKELISDDAIDAVSIALPTYLHAEAACTALEAGKHVLLDKPFAMNADEAKRVVDTAEKNNRIFTVGMNQRFTSEAQTIRAIVERGDLGEIYSAEGYWCRRIGAPRFGTWFGDKSKSGGGTLLDIGVHALDLSLYLVGDFDVRSVTGSVYTKFGNRGLGEGGWGKSDREETVFNVDDFAAALITLASGATIILKTSWARHQNEDNQRDVELFGTEAGASTFPPKVARFGRRDGEYEVVDIQGLEPRYPGMDRMVNWIDAILGEDQLCCTSEQALTVQKVIDGIYESARTGGDVAIER